MPGSSRALHDASNELATVFSGYRVHDRISAITATSVEEWICQFDEDTETKLAFLKELASVYQKTYHPLAKVQALLNNIIGDVRLTGNNPTQFWSNIDVLDIQRGGSSQSDLVNILGSEVRKAYGVSIGSHNTPGRDSLYLDDAIFSGNRIVNDVTSWLDRSIKPASLSVLVLNASTGGMFSVKSRLDPIVNLRPIWFFSKTNNYLNDGGAADVLRLRKYPEDEASAAYLEEFLDGQLPNCFRGSGVNSSPLFTNETSRQLVESVLWKAGVACKDMCTSLPANVKPLGYCSSGGKNKLGFGSLFASYRNCPNSAPAALWVSGPWTPLLRRKTN